MTAPADEPRIAEGGERLREALARSAVEAKLGLEGVAVIFDVPSEATDHQRAVLVTRANEARRLADFALAGPLATLLADHEAALAAERTRAEAAEANLLALADMYGEACRDLVGEADGHRLFARAYGEACQGQAAAEARADRLAAENASLTALLDASWRNVIAYRFPQVFKHLVASDMLSELEVAGFTVPHDLAAAVVDGNDEVALAFPPLARAVPTETPETGGDHAGS